jgi:predicted acylesterase/phospholipase RssA
MEAFKNPEYAAFEGAGGKGVIYVGVVKALELENRLPMTTAKRVAFPGRVLKGVSGSSAGAITTLFIALGCTSEDMSELTSTLDEDKLLLEEKLIDKDGTEWYTGQLVPKDKLTTEQQKKYDKALFIKKDQTIFSLFYDPPSPAVIKAVGKVGTNPNQSGFVNVKVNRNIELDLSTTSKIKKMASQLGLMSLKLYLIDRALVKGVFLKLFPNKKEYVEIDSEPLNILRVHFLYRSLVQFLKLKTFKFRITLSEVIADREKATESGKKIADGAYSIMFPSMPEVILGLASTFSLNRKGKKQTNSKSSDSGNNVSKSSKSKKSDEEEESDPSDLEMMLFNSTEDTKNYVYSVFFDKGIFSGLDVNRVLAAKMSYYLKRNFDVELSVSECANMTFFDFVNLTGNDFRLAVTNLTQKMPRLFSCYLTPDFPVVSATAGSMSIPMAFKPTFFNGTVRLNSVSGTFDANGKLSLVRAGAENSDSPHNKSYRGLFFDGGTLMNLPIHAFDFNGNETNYMQSVVFMKKNMIGIRNSGGLPISKDEDPKYEDDPLYNCYLKLDKRLKGTKDLEKLKDVKSNEKEMVIEYNWSGGYKPLTGTLGDIIGTLLYSMEEGQIRSKDELAATSNFFSYGIDTMDFAVGKHLLAFTQARSFIKMASLLEIDIETIVDVAYTNYYLPFLHEISNKKIVDPPLNEEEIFCLIENYARAMRIYLEGKVLNINNVNE